MKSDNENRNCFPIYYLNESVLSMIGDLKSLGIKNVLANGLNKRIHFEDLQGPITDIASLDFLDRIHLSASYCHFLWSICYVALRMYDGLIVQDEISKLSHSELSQYFKELEKYKGNEVTEELRQYIDWENCIKTCHSVFESGAEIIKQKVNTFEKYYSLPNATHNSQSKVNAIYCYAVVFILNHEISHFVLNHLDVSKKEEVEADECAFWTLFSDVNENQKVSAMIGTLSALCSLMFFNEKLDGDEQHPEEHKRVLSALQIVKYEYPHYIGFVVKLFEMWAYHFGHIDNFKSLKEETEDIEEYFDRILEYFDSLNN